ncbi:MAG: toll/interleukin-1 receptor domain-containing protein [Clostridia bacterium]|nr:toll/interleukin-1 receptor domain-containing protein [Clostridia bacterium]
MKVFVSWSGELSKSIAELIQKWLPCIIQSVDVFFSSNDIEKGENWDSKITSELKESKYGIVCLTEDNVLAPWIHFESGALANTLDAKVATLMVNITPTEIKGPLSRYQATKLERDDFYQLICNINEQCEQPMKPEVLKTLFDNLWVNMNAEFNSIISTHQKRASTKKKQINNDEAIEEILVLLRKQNSIITSPEELLPIRYFSFLNEQVLGNENVDSFEELSNEVLEFLRWTISRCEIDRDLWELFLESQMELLVDNLLRIVRRKKSRRKFYFQYCDIKDRIDALKKKYSAVFE